MGAFTWTLYHIIHEALYWSKINESHLAAFHSKLWKAQALSKCHLTLRNLCSKVILNISTNVNTKMFYSLPPIQIGKPWKLNSIGEGWESMNKSWECKVLQALQIMEEFLRHGKLKTRVLKHFKIITETQKVSKLVERDSVYFSPNISYWLLLKYI